MHLPEWGQDNSYKPSVPRCDSSTAINSNQDLAEWFIFHHHTRFVPLSGASSSLVLNGHTGAHRYLLKLAGVPLQSGAISCKSSCQRTIPVFMKEAPLLSWLVLSWKNRDKVFYLTAKDYLGGGQPNILQWSISLVQHRPIVDILI